MAHYPYIAQAEVTTFPFSPSPARPSPAEKQIAAGEVELELVPQGTLLEANL